MNLSQEDAALPPFAKAFKFALAFDCPMIINFAKALDLAMTFSYFGTMIC